MEELDAEQVRVLGCLLEKERTVPDSYPMTLNSLVTACNQSTNRTPVVSYDGGTVQRTLDDLKDRGLVRFVHPSHGERTTKFRQVIDERLALLPTEAAVLSALFVRGPQTVNEIRTRTDRLHAFDSPEEVVATLRGLAERDEPLARALERQPGEREGRWTHTFAQADLASAVVAPAAPSPSRSALEDRMAALEAKVEHLYSVLGEQPPTL
ncbi:MAG: uncharacterized protein QOC92_3829 [Acidimicrobiaceae bacterium]|jgi:uncharacterized protein YceH (UPF0502 family)